KRQPIPENNDIRLLLPNIITGFNPAEWVHGVDEDFNAQAFGSRLIRILAFAPEQKRWILQAELNYLYLITILLESLCQALVKSGHTATTQWVGRTNYNYTPFRHYAFTEPTRSRTKYSFFLLDAMDIISARKPARKSCTPSITVTNARKNKG